MHIRFYTDGEHVANKISEGPNQTNSKYNFSLFTKVQTQTLQQPPCQTHHTYTTTLGHGRQGAIRKVSETPPKYEKCGWHCQSSIHQRLFCNKSLNHNTRSFAKTFETLILELDVIRKSRSTIEGFSHHYLSKSLGFSHSEKLLQVRSSRIKSTQVSAKSSNYNIEGFFFIFLTLFYLIDLHLIRKFTW